MKAEVIKVTPTLAQQWLEQNKNYRDPIIGHIDVLARDIAAGKWDENGESIKFNKKDELIDGQNRLLACVKADKPFVSVVVYDVDKDLNIDTGAKRSFAQWLKHHGCEHYGVGIAAALRTLWIFRNTKGFSRGENRRGATLHALVQILIKEPGIKDSVIRCPAVAKLIKGSIISTLHHLFKEKDSEMAENFLLGLEEKIELELNDPVAQLRRKLQDNRQAKYKMGDRTLAAITIKAWNCWRTNTPCKCLKFAEVGATVEQFPTIE